MRTALITHSLVLVSTSCLLAACGGGGGGGSTASDPGGTTPPPVVNQSPGGIWQTQYVQASGPTAGDTIKGLAIVDETGSFFFADRDQNNSCVTLGFGQATVTGSSISGNVDEAAATYALAPGVNTNCAFPDGSTSGTGTISGTVTQRSSMAITDSGTTSNGTSLGTETHTWTFNSLYDNSSSLATVSANYWDGSNTFSVNGNGAIFEQDPASGCVINGQISIINAQYNAYSLSLSFSNCAGTAAAANGRTLTGLATLDTTVSPAQLDFGVSTSVNGGGFIVIVDSLPHQ
jgi:hypothetical protein